MRRTALTAFAVVAMVAAAAFVFVGSASAANFGVSILKDCQTPINVGDPYSCEFEIENNVQASGLTVTVKKLSDTVFAAGGNQTFTENVNSSFSGLILAGGATCGATNCTIPFGGSITTPFISHYDAQVGDFPSLADQGGFTWNEVCNGFPGCSAADNNGITSASADINPIPTTAVTSISSGGVNGVSVVATGSSVSDSVTVTSDIPNQPPPTGNVSFQFFDNNTCTGQSADSTTVALDSNGQASGVLPEGPLAPGLYGYLAHFEGSADGAYLPSHDDQCEPLRVVDANIQLTPATATNRVGSNHVLTCHVNVNDGSGQVNAPDGTVCTVTITSGPGSPASQNCTTSGGTGSCTVTISSATTGTSTIQASTDVTVDGVVLHRQTGDGLAGDSPNASKLWVDAAIVIAPSATNEVGQPHTFTATVLTDTGSGFQPVGAGVDCNITLTPSNGANPVPAGPLNTTTNASGQCSITFTSQTAGKVTGHASSTLSVSGSAPFTVQTDGVGADSSDAVKTFVDANIQITPNGTNRVGATHTFTAHVNVNDGSGAGFVDAPAGTQISFSIDSGPGSFTTPNPCTVSAGGDCQIDLVSAVTGVTTVSAHTTLSVGGVTLTRSTDGTGANSGPATKTWVDAKISITPNATNEVNHSHTFTVTLLKDTGDGAGFVPAAGEHVDVTLTDAGGANHTAPTGSCTNAGANTDAAGQCTITFTSPTAGTVTGHATATLSVAGSAPFTVQTDGTGGNSGDAVKTFVDANIQITPANATNPIGTNHVLTITVNAIGGTLDPGPGTATASIVSGPGTFVGSPTCTYTGGGASASCTVTITSNIAGTTVVSATSNIPVSGVSITRTTGTAQNTASGGSDNATKLWVAPDANIQLTPATAVNAVGTNHTLHCHINVSTDGTNFSNAPDGTVCTVNIISGPGTPVSQNCTTTGGTGTCDVVITSSVVGTSTVQATTTLTVNTVTLTRTTGDSNVGDGPNATKNWVDANIQISPATATNAIGTNHVLTITVNALGGTLDAGPHTATASIVSGPGSFVGGNTCTYTGGGPSASCTVTITSSTTGTTVVSATSDIPVSGQTITRTTGTAANTASGGSDNASKTWVDANINITPSTANNPIGTNHVLTITVNALNGTIDAGPHTATASIVSGPGSFVGGVNTCTYTGGAATASCTVTITSSTTGTTVVSATSDIPVNGQTITRTTGTSQNTASGGSGNASKNWDDDLVTTKVLDASNTDVTGSTTITPGTVVHDQATVTKTAGTPAGVPDPTGSVTFTLYDNGTCNGNVLATDANEPLTSGVANSATFTTPATAGSFSYLAHYNGDANYPAKNAGCEPFQTSNPFSPALTPGYWKNHQAATTALLPITLGNYNVNTFAKAYAVFEAMKCSSPIDCLAGHLLAAKLDLKSGSNPSIQPTITQADNLLKAVNYNGPGNFTATAAQKALALQLEVLIDAYTNQ